LCLTGTKKPKLFKLYWSDFGVIEMRQNYIQKALKKVQITNYLRSAQFLTDLYLEIKQIKRSEKEKYSYRSFAKDLGFGQTNHMHLICKGQRVLSNKAAEDIANLIGLKGNEASFLKALVEFDRSKNPEQSEKALSKIYLLKQKSLTRKKALKKDNSSSSDLMEYLGRWYIPVVREAVGLQDFEEDPFWLADKIIPRVRAKELKESLKLLERLGYLTRDEKGRLIQSNQHVQTSAVVKNLGVKKYHQEMLELSRNALQKVSSKEKDFQAMTLPSNAELVKEFKNEIHALLGKFLAKSTNLDDAEDMVQINIQLFPLTNKNIDKI